MSQSKKIFIGLTAVAACPKCNTNFMPYMNMAMCNECGKSAQKCCYCGKKEARCKCCHEIKN